MEDRELEEIEKVLEEHAGNIKQLQKKSGMDKERLQKSLSQNKDTEAKTGSKAH